MEPTDMGNLESEEKKVFENFFKGFKTCDVFLGPVAFICHLKPTNGAQKIDFLRHNLRESLLEISDGLSRVGLSLPIFAVIECKKIEGEDNNKDENKLRDYDKWNEIAGDQDWHRGDFLILPCIEKDEAEKVFKNLKNPIFAPELTYTFKQLTPKDFADYFEEQLRNSTPTNEEEKLENMLYKKLINNFSKSSEFELSKAIDEALESWRIEIGIMIEMGDIDKM